MDTGPVLRAWGSILAGGRPNLSIEITRECPLRCPGCYAYGDTHLGGDVVLRELADLKGQALIDGLLQVVRRQRPIHLSIVGGEPLVRFRELDVVLPQLTAMGVHTQLVTSAVRPIPSSWADMPGLQVVVSIDGLQPEHDVRRTPATYERILKHIAGQHITVHCTLTRQQARPGYVAEFTRFWAANPDVKRIWFSLYTPQIGEDSAERLRPADRALLVAGDLGAVRDRAEAVGHAAVGRARLPQPAAQPRRLHLLEDDGLPVGRLETGDHPVPVRREPRLLAVRLHGLSRAAGPRRLPARRAGPGQRDLQGVDCHRQRRRALARALARLTAARPRPHNPG